MFAVCTKCRLLHHYLDRCSLHTTAAALEKIGFIGLGNMGMPMALNLIKAGHELVVHDRTDAPARLAQQHPVTVADSPQALASTPGMAAVVTMLPHARAVMDVYTGPQGLLAATQGVVPQLLIDSSTIDPGTSRQVAAAVSQAHLHRTSQQQALASSQSGQPCPAFVDAPVSGGVPGAAAATLTFMCGGSPEAFKAAQGYLSVLGKRSVHCGPAGSGSVAKVCNNLVLAVSMAAVAEGLALGHALGMEPKLLSDVFNTSSARCWSSDTYNPAPGVMEGVPSSRSYQGGFATSLMLKDLGLAAQAAQQAGAPVPLTQAVEALYQQVAQKDGTLDFSALFKYVYQDGTKKP